VLEVDVDRQHDPAAVEERTDGNLDTTHAPLQLEYFYRVGVDGLVGLEHVDHVLAAVFLSDEQQALDILGFAAWLDDVGARVLPDVGDRRIEVCEFRERDDRHAVLFELLLAEAAVVLEPVRIRGAADHRLAGLSKLVRQVALPEYVVEHNDVGPVGVRLPVVDLGYEAISNVALVLVANVVAHVVAFVSDPPGNVTDQTVDRYE